MYQPIPPAPPMPEPPPPRRPRGPVIALIAFIVVVAAATTVAIMATRPASVATAVAAPTTPTVAVAPYTPAVTTPAAPNMLPMDARFLADVQPRLSAYAWAGGNNQTNLINLAHAACSALDSGVTAGTLIIEGERDFSQADILAIIGAAVRLQCPSHVPDLINWVANQ